MPTRTYLLAGDDDLEPPRLAMPRCTGIMTTGVPRLGARIHSLTEPDSSSHAVAVMQPSAALTGRAFMMF